MKLPTFLYRDDDGERFTLNSNGKYTMDSSKMNPKYEYNYDCLMSFGFVDSLDNCHISQIIHECNGHE